MPTAKAFKKAQRFNVPMLLSLKEAAKEYGFKVWFLRERIWKGEIPFFQPDGGRKMYIRREDLNRYVEQNLKQVD